MMVFGKRCPACGGKKLTAKPPASRMASLPMAKTFCCGDCQQQFVFVFLFSIGIENRQHPRKKLPPFFLIRVPGRSDQYSKIKNISEGGICFGNLFNNTAAMTSRFLLLDIYNCNDGSSLEQLTAEIVGTSEQLLDINGIKTRVRNNCARFVNLNQAQKKVLFTCLSQYGMP